MTPSLDQALAPIGRRPCLTPQIGPAWGARAAPRRLAQPQGVVVPMAFASVLMVDGDIAALAAAGAVLNAAGYAVEESLNGRRALQRVMASPPDVLITEILMQDGDGIELITAVKRARPDVRIIAVTEHRFLGELDLFDLASRLGADAVLDKPPTAEKLLAAVARLVGLDARPGLI
jgi:DNA-binding NtrC family response regulator